MGQTLTSLTQPLLLTAEGENPTHHVDSQAIIPQWDKQARIRKILR